MFEKDVDERLKIVFRAMKVNPEAGVKRAASGGRIV